MRRYAQLLHSWLIQPNLDNFQPMSGMFPAVFFHGNYTSLLLFFYCFGFLWRGQSSWENPAIVRNVSPQGGKKLGPSVGQFGTSVTFDTISVSTLQIFLLVQCARTWRSVTTSEGGESQQAEPNGKTWGWTDIFLPDSPPPLPSDWPFHSWLSESWSVKFWQYITHTHFLHNSVKANRLGGSFLRCSKSY